MGLFDTIIVNYPLPLPQKLEELTNEKFKGLDFQTKSLDCCLDQYFLEKNGVLYIKDCESERTDNNYKTNLTGEIVFYTSIEKESYKYDYWVEFKAIFIGGQVSKIELVEFTFEDSAPRKERQKEWEQKCRKRDLLFKKWYIKYLYVPYSKIIRFICRKTSRVLNYLVSNTWRIERFLDPL